MVRIAIAYIPVIHRGYVEFLERLGNSSELLILGEEILRDYDHLYRKDIRAIDPFDVQEALKAINVARTISVADYADLRSVNYRAEHVVMPDEDISHDLATRLLGKCSVEFDSVFLRRDRKRTVGEVSVSPDISVSRGRLYKELMIRAQEVAGSSPDWWYHIGALAVRNGEILIAGFNTYVPSPHTAYAFGDPRIHFKAGVEFELTQALHAESRVVYEAAKSGISLDGADLYSTMFPCPWCAKAIAYSGIARLFFCEGYSRLDGESILRSQKVEIIQVE